jgi:hypothetical protein
MAGTVLQRPDYIEDLGVIFDTKLTFNAHLDLKLAKASSRVWASYFVVLVNSMMNMFINPSTLPFVRPIIEHA